MSHKSLARFIPLSILTALVALTVGSATPAHGASFTVTATHDAVDAAPGDGICADAGGSCTLRAAVMETNALPGADEISLPAGTYLLSISGRGEDGAATGDLDVTDSLTITGAGDQTTAIDADGIDRVLHISGSATVLGLSGVTVTGGNMAPVFDPAILCFPLHYGGGGVCISSGRLNLTDAEVRSNHSDNHGGGVLIGMTATMSAVSTDFHENSSLRSGGAFSNFGIASVSNASISGNRAPAGGAIRNTGDVPGVNGLLTIENTTIEDNHGSIGGGIDNGFGGHLTIDGSTIAGNDAATGGGIYSAGGIPDVGADPARIVLRDSVVRGNSAGIAGGFYNASANTRSVATIERVTVSDNTARNLAGGIFNAGDLSLSASTVSGNTARSRGGGLLNAGAIDVPGVFGRATLTNSTISGNTGGERGGGIRNVGTLSTTNVTIADNSAENGGNLERSGFDSISLLNTLIGDAQTGGDCGTGPPPLSLGHNLDSDGTCGLTGPGDLVERGYALLGPLSDNGGPTQTHADSHGVQPMRSTPAITTGCPATDQRGFLARWTADGDGLTRCDIGAVEPQVIPGPPAVPCPGDPSCPPSPRRLHRHPRPQPRPAPRPPPCFR